MDETQPCERCRSSIPVSAMRCPACGYEPAAEGSAGRTVLLLIGAVLTLSVVGAPIGIPLMVWAFYARSKANGQRPAMVAET